MITDVHWIEDANKCKRLSLTLEFQAELVFDMRGRNQEELFAELGRTVFGELVSGGYLNNIRTFKVSL